MNSIMLPQLLTLIFVGLGKQATCYSFIKKTKPKKKKKEEKKRKKQLQKKQKQKKKTGKLKAQRQAVPSST